MKIHGRGPGFRSRRSQRLKREQRARMEHEHQMTAYHDDLSGNRPLEALQARWAGRVAVDVANFQTAATVPAPWYVRMFRALRALLGV
jgi:hypothetical protein